MRAYEAQVAEDARLATLALSRTHGQGPPSKRSKLSHSVVRKEAEASVSRDSSLDAGTPELVMAPLPVAVVERSDSAMNTPAPAAMPGEMGTTEELVVPHGMESYGKEDSVGVPDRDGGDGAIHEAGPGAAFLGGEEPGPPDGQDEEPMVDIMSFGL